MPIKRRPFCTLFIIAVAIAIVASMLASAAWCQHIMPNERGKLKATPAVSWEGYYSVAGYDGLDAGELQKYLGLCCVRKFKAAYHVQALNGQVTTLGTGQVKDGCLCVGWTVMLEGKVLSRGVTIYRRSGNDLIGSWIALPGSGVVRDEKLTWRGPVSDDVDTIEPPKASAPASCPSCPCGPGCQCDPCNCGEKALEPKKGRK